MQQFENPDFDRSRSRSTGAQVQERKKDIGTQESGNEGSKAVAGSHKKKDQNPDSVADDRMHQRVILQIQSIHQSAQN